MARRSDHSREELKEMAICAGRELIRKEGFAKFSARRVATEIGYTVGTLYNVFGSYDDLILSINAQTLDDWFDAMQELLAQKRGTEALPALAVFYIRYSADHAQEWLALFEHHMSEGREVPEWYAQKMARFFLELEALLSDVMGKNAHEVSRAAYTLWAGVHGIAMLSLSDKLEMVGAESEEVLAMSFVECYLRGLAHA